MAITGGTYGLPLILEIFTIYFVLSRLQHKILFVTQETVEWLFAVINNTGCLNNDVMHKQEYKSTLLCPQLTGLQCLYLFC